MANMNIFSGTFLLRLTVAVILLMHSIPGIFNNGINDFGNKYLNEIGFSPMGVYIAWAIKGSHILCAVLLLINRYIALACWITIFILIMGIMMVHYQEGWFVVGGGRNGMEFNVLLIAVLLYIFITDGRKSERIIF